MTCGPEPQRFRMLRAAMHWRQDLVASGSAEIGEAIRLRATPQEIDEIIDRHFLPPHLARGCGPCDWYLVIADAACPMRGLFRLIGERWCEVRPGGCRLELASPVAIGAAGERLAVLDRGRREIVVLARGLRRITATIPFTGTGPIALDARGLVYAADRDEVRVFDRNGDELRRVRLPGAVLRLAVDACGGVWIVVAGARVTQVWTWRDGRLAQLHGDPDSQLAPLGTTGVTVHGQDRFCIALPRGADAPARRCFDRCGRPVEISEPPVRLSRSGEVATVEPIDSHMPRCRWHRVRLDADVPDGTSIVVEVAAVERGSDVPHPADWQAVHDDAADFLIQQPAGRYLHLRVRLAATGVATPVIRSIRLDFPRSTSAEWLPAVYRDAPEAGDFLVRFLAIFDATVEDMDRAIERFPALLDAGHAPGQALPWLASLVGATLDASWSLARRRAVLEQLPELYRRRGTPAGLRLAIETIAGQSPVIEELAAPSPFGALAAQRAANVPGGARVGTTRLFGRGRARARLGSSKLGATELRSYGDPDDDARSALAFRINVLLPAATGTDLARLERLVEAQVPAHVIARVRVGEPSVAVGTAAAVGIDTLLTGPPRPILGTNVRLRRRSVLWPGASRGDAAIAVGRAAAVGIQTISR